MKKRSGNRKTGKSGRAASRRSASRRRRTAPDGGRTLAEGSEETAAPDYELGDEHETPQYPRVRPSLQTKNPAERKEEANDPEREKPTRAEENTGTVTASDAKKFFPKIPLRFPRDAGEAGDKEGLIGPLRGENEDAAHSGGVEEENAGAGLAPSGGRDLAPLISGVTEAKREAREAKARTEAQEAEAEAKAKAADSEKSRDEDYDKTETKAWPVPRVSVAPVAARTAREEMADVAPRFADAVAVRPRGVSRGLAIVTALAVFLVVPGALYYLANENRELRKKLDGLEDGLAALATRPVEAQAEEAGSADTGDGAVPDAAAGKTGTESATPAGTAADASLAAAAEEASVEGRERADGVRAQIAAVETRLAAIEKRTKLVNYADEAISSGSRYAFSQLEKAYEDPAMLDLRSAANAEISRVEAFFVATAGARYQAIPVQMVDPDLRSDTELTVEHLAQLILSSSVPPLGRARSAELLGKQPLIEACDLLVEVVKTEPNLVVLLEATRSFKKLTGYPSGEVFGGRELERWFGENRTPIDERLKAGASP